MLVWDSDNAFNSVERSEVFAGVVREGFGAMLPYLRLFYGAPSPLYYQTPGDHHLLWSQRGVRQGDPLGPFLFALAQQEALREVQAALPEGIVVSYLDDGSIVGPLEVLPRVFQVLREALARLGMRVQPAKCHLYSPTGAITPQLLAQLDGVQEATEGVVLLGVPLGDEGFVRTHIQEAFEQFAAGLEELEQLDEPQIAMTLMRECVVHRPGFLTRMVDPSAELTAAAEGFDRRVWETVRRILGQASPIGLAEEDSDWVAQEVTHFPVRMGGLGLRSAAWFAPLSYLCSWAQTLPALMEDFPALFPPHEGRASDDCPGSVVAREALPAVVRDGDERHGPFPTERELAEGRRERLFQERAGMLYHDRWSALLRHPSVTSYPQQLSRLRSISGLGGGPLRHHTAPLLGGQRVLLTPGFQVCQPPAFGLAHPRVFSPWHL
jgi:hypothetical protein